MPPWTLVVSRWKRVKGSTQRETIGRTGHYSLGREVRETYEVDHVPVMGVDPYEWELVRKTWEMHDLKNTFACEC